MIDPAVVQSGAPLAKVIQGVKKCTDNFTKRDTVVVIGGTNNLERSGAGRTWLMRTKLWSMITQYRLEFLRKRTSYVGVKLLKFLPQTLLHERNPLTFTK